MIKYVMGYNHEQTASIPAGSRTEYTVCRADAAKLIALQRAKPYLYLGCTMLVLYPVPKRSEIVFHNASQAQIANIFAELEKFNEPQATS